MPVRCMWRFATLWRASQVLDGASRDDSCIVVRMSATMMDASPVLGDSPLCGELRERSLAYAGKDAGRTASFAF